MESACFGHSRRIPRARLTATNFRFKPPLGLEVGRGRSLSASSPNRSGLSLCMIVRDNEGTIRPCLESIRPWVDEMIVVDTGSTDRTPQICQELGAQRFFIFLGATIFPPPATNR